jgi:hypothetical protein
MVDFIFLFPSFHFPTSLLTFRKNRHFPGVAYNLPEHSSFVLAVFFLGLLFEREILLRQPEQGIFDNFLMNLTTLLRTLG